MLSCGGDSATSVQTTDKEIPLPPNSIQLTGHLEGYIQNSIANWNKGRLPYDEFVNFFRTHAAPQFALGEMWGKAVRSGSMFYRYTKDPELKTILDNTVQDLLSTQNENGSISCTPVDQQPGAPGGVFRGAGGLPLYFQSRQAVGEGI